MGSPTSDGYWADDQPFMFDTGDRKLDFWQKLELDTNSRARQKRTKSRQMRDKRLLEQTDPEPTIHDKLKWTHERLDDEEDKWNPLVPITTSDVYTGLELQEVVSGSDSPPGQAKDFIGVGDMVRCMTSWVEEFDLFFVQRCDEIETLHQFEESMRAHYQRVLPIGFTTLANELKGVENSKYSPGHGEILKGRYFAIKIARIPSETEKWYRCQVLKFSEDDVVVRLIDYGNLCRVKPKFLRKLIKEYLITQRVFAIPCKFRPSDLLTEQFKAMLQSSQLVMGQLMSQFLFKEKGHELMKFYHLGFHSNLNDSAWEVSSILIHFYKPQILTPLGDTIADVVVRKFFINKERPKPEPVYVDMIYTDWDYEDENPDVCAYPSTLLEHWKHEQSYQQRVSRLKGIIDPEYKSSHKSTHQLVEKTSMEFELLASRIFTDFVYENDFLAPTEKRVDQSSAQQRFGRKKNL